MHALRKPSPEVSRDWPERQAESIIDEFMADGSPEDLLRLEQAIAEALRQAYQRGQEQRSIGADGGSGSPNKRKKK
jgi:hypothetical protein